uniref:H(+)-transporting two-sector ATPase n=1 Tax=Viscum scurruloideum TaxID=1664545 RepID=A0A0H3WI57_9MAGN|nr:ATPase subunit 8 [Viscum scurruloideum]
MPQLDAFTYWTQFIWLCLVLSTYYIYMSLVGVRGLSCIRKVRFRLRTPGRTLLLKEIDMVFRFQDEFSHGFRTGVYYLSEYRCQVSNWCTGMGWYWGHRIKRLGLLGIGEITGQLGVEGHISWLSRSDLTERGSPCRTEVSLVHVLLGQNSLFDYHADTRH